MTFRLDAFVIGLVIFSLFIVGGTFIISDISNNYGVDMNTSEFSNTYNTINDMYGLSQDMKNDSLDAEISGSDQTWESMTKGSYSGIRKVVKGSFKLVFDIVNDVADTLQIPAFFVTALILIITLSIVFGLIFLFLRFKP